MKYSLRSLMPKRRWFQFSLKTMLIVITLLCVGPGGYVAYEQAKARRQKAAVKAIEKLGGLVEYGGVAQPRSATLRQVLGDETFGTVVGTLFHYADTVPDDGLVNFIELPQLKSLSLANKNTTDAGLEHLAGLTQLERLYLGQTKVTDAGLVHLVGMKRLKQLDLENTKVSGAGLVHLAGLKQLELLILGKTQVADDGLVHLAGLTQLKCLFLFRTKVTDAGVAELQKALPNCEIIRG